MNIYTLKLRDYRNYKILQIKPSERLNVFTGANAQGKTNIIEAIYYASLGTSYRCRRDYDLIFWQADAAKIEVKYRRLNIDNKLDITLSKTSRKKILLNEAPILQKNLPGNLLCVLFAPEDLMIIKGAPTLRRRFLDIELSQTDKYYYSALVSFNRILQQRNNLLKALKKKLERVQSLEVWDEQLSKVAAFIWQRRISAIKEMDILASSFLHNISGPEETLHLNYKLGTSCSKQKNLAKDYCRELKERREADIWRGSTGAGPHHDDIEFYLNGTDAKTFGSQGQQRSVILALKLAELEYIKKMEGHYPLLLLDDVMSELDGNRRTQMLNFLSEHKIQSFVTATDREMFDEVAAKFYCVRQGSVEVDER